MDSEHLVVLATIAGQEDGVALAEKLVAERLAACVQVIPGGTAVYRWQETQYVEPQVQLIIKTSQSAWKGLRARLLELHPDRVPDMLALPVVDGLPAYLAWISENTDPAAPQGR